MRIEKNPVWRVLSFAHLLKTQHCGPDFEAEFAPLEVGKWWGIDCWSVCEREGSCHQPWADDQLGATAGHRADQVQPLAPCPSESGSGIAKEPCIRKNNNFSNQKRLILSGMRTPESLPDSANSLLGLGVHLLKRALQTSAVCLQEGGGRPWGLEVTGPRPHDDECGGDGVGAHPRDGARARRRAAGVSCGVLWGVGATLWTGTNQKALKTKPESTNGQKCQSSMAASLSQKIRVFPSIP